MKAKITIGTADGKLQFLKYKKKGNLLKVFFDIKKEI